MAGRLAAVPEETTNGFTAPYPPGNLYRDWIRRVASYGRHIRPSLFTRSRRTHSSSLSGYTSDSSHVSNNSGFSSGSASAAASAGFFGGYELTEIAHRMVSDGYAQRMVQEFETGDGAECALKTWFLELDVDWVLQIREEPQLQEQDKSPSSLHELAEKWIRALTVIVIAIKELVHGTPAAARFGKESVAKMLVFIDAVVPALKVEKLQAVLNMYVCVSDASNYMLMTLVISPEDQSIFNEIGLSLESQGSRLSEAISTTMEEVRSLMEDEESWAIEIPRGGGDIHKNTRFMVDCIVSIREAWASTQNSASSQNIVNLRGLMDETIDYLKDLLWRKSEQCSDPSLRYLFLLNNFHFITQSSVSLDLVKLWCGLTPECKKYMDSYLDASWGDVMSIMPDYPRPFRRWNNKSSLSKFESAFRKTCQAQKFWKVPDPRLRFSLRKAIVEWVISGYRRDFLKEQPIIHTGSNHPKEQPKLERSVSYVLEEMLGELFEG
ncbi:unnamed protein product [Alopecurus aequalis]